ncbi:MAG: LemA family protein [Microscillaceae bacterium]|nr:LemA family protein [Microscillaceae bacterium]
MLIFYILTNNAAVSQAEEVAKKWAQVENVYQRRADLIPKLVQTVQAAANFEREILEKLSKAQGRLQAIRVDADKLSGEDLAQFQKGQAELSASLNQLLLLAQKNPELSANQAFRDLLVQIEGSENRISVERKRFNEAVSDYNAYIKRFPASLLGFDEKAYFKMEAGADQSPQINLQ